MRKSLILLCAILALSSLAWGCQPAEDTAAHEAFDGTIHRLEQEYAAFYLLGPDADAQDVRDKIAGLSSSWKDVEAAAEGLDDVDLFAASEAHDALVQAVEGLPADYAEGEPMNVAMPLFETFKAEIEEVHEKGGFHDE
jgi:ABC-type phosphate/phosphonate transport system substrate-binding protein